MIEGMRYALRFSTTWIRVTTRMMSALRSLPQQCILSVGIQPILALVKHERYREENNSIYISNNRSGTLKRDSTLIVERVGKVYLIYKKHSEICKTFALISFVC